ncbi:MAG: P-loop NTPase, partial [bacterium]|nr:P-loop NTPase [bacterium]
GDAQLSLVQSVPITAAIVVTTPQDVALLDAKKAVTMFEKTGTPILGIVENMSYFICPHCQEKSDIFGHGGGKLYSDQLKVPFLGEIPINLSLRESGDEGTPIVLSDRNSEVTKAFTSIADKVIHKDKVTFFSS